MTTDRRQPRSVSTILDDVLKRVDPEQRLHAYRLWSFWEDEVGAAIARRAQPTQLRNGVLFVATATHSWMQELQFMKETIRQRLNARLGAELIRDIFFEAGNTPTPQSDAAAADIRRNAPGRALVPLPPIADAALAQTFGRIIAARAKRVAPTSPKR